MLQSVSFKSDPCWLFLSKIAEHGRAKEGRLTEFRRIPLVVYAGFEMEVA